MNRDDIVTLMKTLGCSQIKPDRRGGWMDSTCPMAPYRHTGGVDKHPSFGISIHDNGESKYKCFTCGAAGLLIKLLWRIEDDAERTGKPLPHNVNMASLNYWIEVRNIHSNDDLKKRSDSVQIGNWGKDLHGSGLSLTATTARKLEEAPPPLPESDLEKLSEPTQEVQEWLSNRRLTEATWKLWEVKWHPQAQRVAIPIRNIKGELVGISGRAWRKDQKPKFLHSSGFRRDFYLYGEQRLRKGEPGYLTEGFFDVMYLQQNGINAFAIMGSYLSLMQVEKCLSMFTRIVIVPDGDKPGMEAANRIVAGLGGRIPISIAEVPEGKDPDELSDLELEAVRKCGC